MAAGIQFESEPLAVRSQLTSAVETVSAIQAEILSLTVRIVFREAAPRVLRHFSEAEGNTAMRNDCATLMRVLLVIGIALASSSIMGQPNVAAVEEDWELIVTAPDPAVDAPQVTCVISPLGHANGVYAVFELNQQTLPVYVPGGLQLQIWNADAPLTERRFPTPGLMRTSPETVTWTQSMRLDGNVLTFEIVAGESTTWGAFGGQGYLRGSITTGLETLNAYTPDVSVANSKIGFAGNRVQSLKLKAVRLILSDGSRLEDTTARLVHPRQ